MHQNCSQSFAMILLFVFPMPVTLAAGCTRPEKFRTSGCIIKMPNTHDDGTAICARLICKRRSFIKSATQAALDCGPSPIVCEITTQQPVLPARIEGIQSVK